MPSFMQIWESFRLFSHSVWSVPRREILEEYVWVLRFVKQSLHFCHFVITQKRYFFISFILPIETSNKRVFSIIYGLVKRENIKWRLIARNGDETSLSDKTKKCSKDFRTEIAYRCSADRREKLRLAKRPVLWRFIPSFTFRWAILRVDERSWMLRSRHYPPLFPMYFTASALTPKGLRQDLVAYILHYTFPFFRRCRIISRCRISLYITYFNEEVIPFHDNLFRSITRPEYPYHEGRSKDLARRFTITRKLIY